jgi:hypothetical protein
MVYYVGESAVLIPLLLDAGRTVRANVTFDAGLLDVAGQHAAGNLDALEVVMKGRGRVPESASLIGAGAVQGFAYELWVALGETPQ